MWLVETPPMLVNCGLLAPSEINETTAFHLGEAQRDILGNGLGVPSKRTIVTALGLRLHSIGHFRETLGHVFGSCLMNELAKRLLSYRIAQGEIGFDSVPADRDPAFVPNYPTLVAEHPGCNVIVASFAGVYSALFDIHILVLTSDHGWLLLLVDAKHTKGGTVSLHQVKEKFQMRARLIERIKKFNPNHNNQDFHTVCVYCSNHSLAERKQLTSKVLDGAFSFPSIVITQNTLKSVITWIFAPVAMCE